MSHVSADRVSQAAVFPEPPLRVSGGGAGEDPGFPGDGRRGADPAARQEFPGDMPHQDDHHPAAGADCRQCGREGPAGLHHARAVEQLVRA